MVDTYQEAQEELYEWVQQTIEEWYAFQIVDDRQMLALTKLSHEIEKFVLYELRK